MQIDSVHQSPKQHCLAISTVLHKNLLSRAAANTDIPLVSEEFLTEKCEKMTAATKTASSHLMCWFLLLEHQPSLQIKRPCREHETPQSSFMHLDKPSPAAGAKHPTLLLVFGASRVGCFTIWDTESELFHLSLPLYFYFHVIVLLSRDSGKEKRDVSAPSSLVFLSMSSALLAL